LCRRTIQPEPKQHCYNGRKLYVVTIIPIEDNQHMAVEDKFPSNHQAESWMIHASVRKSFANDPSRFGQHGSQPSRTPQEISA
jgi:hypothetical protein